MTLQQKKGKSSVFLRDIPTHSQFFLLHMQPSLDLVPVSPWVFFFVWERRFAAQTWCLCWAICSQWWMSTNFYIAEEKQWQLASVAYVLLLWSSCEVIWDYFFLWEGKPRFLLGTQHNKNLGNRRVGVCWRPPMSHAHKVSKSLDKLKNTCITCELSGPCVQESILWNEWESEKSEGENEEADVISRPVRGV